MAENVTLDTVEEQSPVVYFPRAAGKVQKGRRAGMRHSHVANTVSVSSMPLPDGSVAVGYAIARRGEFSRKLGRHISAERCLLAAAGVTRRGQKQKWGVFSETEARTLIKELRETERRLLSREETTDGSTTISLGKGLTLVTYDSRLGHGSSSEGNVEC